MHCTLSCACQPRAPARNPLHSQHQDEHTGGRLPRAHGLPATYPLITAAPSDKTRTQEHVLPWPAARRGLLIRVIGACPKGFMGFHWQLHGQAMSSSARAHSSLYSS